MEPNTIHCPKCSSTQLHFAKKGFSGKKAVVGGILTGGLGLFAGTIGSNKILANCMSCGNKFSPSEINPVKNSHVPFKVDPPIFSKGKNMAALVISIIIAAFFSLLLIMMTITYFELEKSDAKSGLRIGLIFIILITSLFLFLSKKYYFLSKNPPTQTLPGV